MSTTDDKYLFFLSRAQSRSHIRDKKNKILVAVIFLVELWGGCVLFVYASGSPGRADLSLHVRVQRSKLGRTLESLELRYTTRLRRSTPKGLKFTCLVSFQLHLSALQPSASFAFSLVFSLTAFLSIFSSFVFPSNDVCKLDGFPFKTIT